MVIEDSKKVIYIVNKNIPKWARKKLWGECNDKEKGEANLMEIPINNILLDYESDEEYKRGREEVENEYKFFEVWDTHSKEHLGGKHIILRFSDLSLYNMETRNEIRRVVIKKFKADETKHSEKTFIPIPYKPHYKSGEIYSLIEKFSGLNKINTYIIKEAEEVYLRNQEIQSQINPDEDFKDYFENDELWKILNKINWEKMPNSCNFNNTLSKNLAIASAKTGKSKQEINNIIKPFINKIKGYNFNSFDGWLRKALLGELDNYNYYELNKWSTLYLKKEVYKTIVPSVIDKKISLFANKLDLAKQFYKIQPYFYDKSRNYWIWDIKNKKYTIVDKTDLLNSIEKYSSVNTIGSKQKTEIIEAIEQIGRQNIPKKPKYSWIQFKDKTIDIETDEEFDATPEYFHSNTIPWKLGESEDTKIIDKIFKEWVVNKKQNETWITTLYEIISYCMLPAMPLHRIICLLGGGSNGKGSFMRMIEKFIGKDNSSASDLDSLLKNNFETSKLYKKLVCFIGEVDRTVFSRTRILKVITGDDLARIEFKGKNSFDEHLYAKPIIACNELPETTDKQDGFFRRWLIVDFINQFNEKIDIISTIPEKEFENLGRKCIEILKVLLKRGTFTNEGSIADRRKRYEIRSSPLDKFIKEYCIKNNQDKIISREFYEKFSDFLKSSNHRYHSEIEVSKLLKLRGYTKKVIAINTDMGLKTTVMMILGLKWEV